MVRKFPAFARALLGLFAVLFVWSAYLQLNDPDPAFWVTAYAGAALLAFGGAVNRPAPWPIAATSGAALTLYGLHLCWVVFFSGATNPMYPGHEPTGWLIVDTEQGREMGGSLIMGAVLLMLAAGTFGSSARVVERSDLP